MIHGKPFKCSKSLWLATVIVAAILSVFSSGYTHVLWPEKMKNPKVLPKSGAGYDFCQNSPQLYWLPIGGKGATRRCYRNLQIECRNESGFSKPLC